MRTGHVALSWEKLLPAWKSIFAATVLAFLEERGCGLIANEAMSEKQEDEQIRLFCEGLTARRRNEPEEKGSLYRVRQYVGALAVCVFRMRAACPTSRSPGRMFAESPTNSLPPEESLRADRQLVVEPLRTLLSLFGPALLHHL